MDLSSGELSAALAPLRRARSMPADVYTSEEFYKIEQDYIFLKQWFFLCREDQLPNAGDYRASTTPGGPVLMVRGEDRQLRCFANYCRHRGSLLLEGEGNCGKRIMCPYHAWSYFSDGRLYGCPAMEDAEGFDRTENGLVPLRLDSWSGFVFANFDRSAKPLIEHLGDLPARLGSHHLERMRCTWKKTFETSCNWKLILENAMETYHTGIVHKNTVGAQQQRSFETQGDWLCMQVISGTSIATLPGVPPLFPSIATLDEDAKQGTYFTVVLPTCQFAVAQDTMWWLNVTPLAHDRSVLEVGGCFPEEVTEWADFEVRAKPYYERWEAVAREDIGILEKQQIALTSKLFKPGPLSVRDDMVQKIGQWVIEKLRTSQDTRI